MRFKDVEDHDEHGDGVDDKALTIIVAATFFVVGIALLTLLLYFYVKHLLLRHQQRRSRLDLLYRISVVPQTAPPPNPAGLDPLIIASLPTTSYKQTEQFREGQVMECSVCLTTLVEDATIRVLPNCNHVFHVDCIDMWFTSNSTCPVCRAVVAEAVGHDHQHVVQSTTPPGVEDGGVSRDANHHEMENVGCSGLRIASFSSMVNISRDRSRKNVQSSDGSDSIEDVEKQ